MTPAARSSTSPSVARGRSSKAKRSVTLDADLVEQVEGSHDGNLSAILNDALRDHVDRRREQAALVAWLDRMEQAEGPPDPAEVASFRRLLGGTDMTAP